MTRDLVADVAVRLDGGLPGLKSVDGALALAELVKGGRLPNATPAAFVVAGGESGAPRANATGPLMQQVTERVTVLLLARGSDRSGARARDALDALRLAARGLLVGWSPEPATIEPFELDRGRVSALGGGAGLYELTLRTRYRLRATA